MPNGGFSLDDYDDELDQMDYAKNACLRELQGDQSRPAQGQRENEQFGE